MSSIGSIFDYVNEPSGRKVTASSEGEKVVNEGDTSLFKKNEMGKDQFLNLLVTQLRYQDPLNPAQDTEFVTQLAQFSQLEFTQNSTSAISTLASNMQAFMDLQNLQAQSITNASATPLLGKDVRVMESSFHHKGSCSRDFNIYVMEGYSQGNVVVKNKDGDVVAEIGFSLEDSKGGDITVKWNGKNRDNGEFYLGGDYTVEVMSVNGTKNIGYAFQDGMVSGVNFSSTGATLTVGENQYGLGYLVKVNGDDISTADAISGLYKKIEELIKKENT
jgi:flagellar basal-body rod modification protein FlgD